MRDRLIRWWWVAATGVAAFGWLPVCTADASVSIRGIHPSNGDGYSRVVIELSTPTAFQYGFVAPDAASGKPPRVYVDIQDVVLERVAGDVLNIEDGRVRRVRTGQYQPHVARVVLELDGDVKPRVLAVENRIVIDLPGTARRDASQNLAGAAKDGSPPAASNRQTAAPQSSTRTSEREASQDSQQHRGQADDQASRSVDARQSASDQHRDNQSPRLPTTSHAPEALKPPVTAGRGTALAVMNPADRSATNAKGGAIERATEGGAAAEKPVTTGASDPLQWRSLAERSGAVAAPRANNAPIEKLNEPLLNRAPSSLERLESRSPQEIAAARSATSQTAPAARGAAASALAPQPSAAKTATTRQTSGNAASTRAPNTASAPLNPPVTPGRGTGMRMLPPSGAVASAHVARPIRIVIDPGHGGKDPGAEGPAGSEKDSVLDIASRLAAKLKAGLNVEVHLTRTDDTYVPLDKRKDVANRLEADMFVSIHANASRNNKLFGIETYYLKNSNDRATLRLARLENGVDMLIKGVDVSTDADLNYILSDIIQGQKEADSILLANHIQGQLCGNLERSYDSIRSLGVKQGPFLVLDGTYMPAVLVETGFITNASEGRRLRAAAYRESVAEGIYRGIKAYLEDDRVNDLT